MKANNEEIFSKLKEDVEQKLKEPLSFYKMNTIIFEDDPNKTIKVYDSSLFDNMKTLKTEKIENQEINNEFDLEEKRKKLEKEKNDFQSYILKMKNLISDIEANTNEIKMDLEQDQKKKEELRIKEIQRLEREKKEREEREKKEREEQEKIRKQLEEQERLRKLQEEKNRQNNLISGLDNFNNAGRNIKERLINAGKNFENIQKEKNKIMNNKNLESYTLKILIAINDIIINKTTSIKDIDKSIDNLYKLFGEIKQKNNEELYLFACYNVLAIIFKKLNGVDNEIDYENVLINAKIICKLNSKTLTYMLFQRISNKCPYIIPLPYNKEEYDRIFPKKNLKEVYKFCKDAEYLYFVFLYLDTNKYSNIIENYISNLEEFTYDKMTFLITNSFLCFIDVFGNFIWRNKRNWMNRIVKIKETVIKGLNEELKKITNTGSHLIAINKSIKIKIENCFNNLDNNKYTNFAEKFFEINRM